VAWGERGRAGRVSWFATTKFMAGHDVSHETLFERHQQDEHIARPMDFSGGWLGGQILLRPFTEQKTPPSGFLPAAPMHDSVP